MKKNQKSHAVLSLKWLAIAGAVASLGACGGSSNSNSTPASAPVAGKIADGYITGATVTLDLNDDRICGGGDASSTADATGGFMFNAAQNPGNAPHMICASGGKDLSTGLAFEGQLKAPSGSTAVTPLTNLTMAQINSTLPAPVAGVPSPVTTAQASSASNAVAAALGLTGVNLLTTDPVAAAATIPALIRTTTAVHTMTSSVAAGVTGSATGQGASATTTANVTSAVYDNAVQALLAAVTATPLTSSAGLSTLAGTVVSGTVTRAAANPVVTSAAPGISGLSPTSAASFLGSSISSSVASVVAAPASTLAATTASANNPAAIAQTTAANLSTSATLVSGLLTSAVAAANPNFASANSPLAQLSTTLQTAIVANQNNPTGNGLATAANAVNNQISSTAPGNGPPLTGISPNQVAAAATKASTAATAGLAKAAAAATAGAQVPPVNVTGATGN